jgi:hypothetical protein
MKRHLLRLLPLIVAASALSACTTYVKPPPPPAKVEVRPVPPHQHAVWVPGHWKWKGPKKGYTWMPGHWRVHR